MLKLIRLVVVAVLAVSLAVLAAPFFRADAATNPVTVHKIATKTVASGASATVRPNVSTAGQVKVTSKKLTVKKGSKTVGSGSLVNGVAGLRINGLKIGTNKLTVTYGGDAATNSGALNFTIKAVKPGGKKKKK